MRSVGPGGLALRRPRSLCERGERLDGPARTVHLDDGALVDLDRRLVSGYRDHLVGAGRTDADDHRSSTIARELDLPRSSTYRLLSALVDRSYVVHLPEEKRYGLCSVDLSGSSAAACRQLPPTIPVGLAGELLAAQRGAPARMFAQGPEGDSGWRQAIYDARSGDELVTVARRPSGGFVWDDGGFAWVGLAPPMAQTSLYRFRDGLLDAPAPIAAEGQPSAGPRMVWDEVVWTLPLDDGRHRLLARRAFRACGCRDVARVDFVLTETGRLCCTDVRPVIDVFSGCLSEVLCSMASR